MNKTIHPSPISGTITLPTSKSHTIRAVVLATLANSTSTLVHPLVSEDTEAAIDAARAFGAEVDRGDDRSWRITGNSIPLQTPIAPVNTRNSGITTRFFLPLAGLCDGGATFTCGEQMRARPMAAMLAAVESLGCKVRSFGASGCLPVKVSGTLTAGEMTIDGTSSQYLSALLLSCPLLAGKTTIHVPNLNEKPYVEMTTRWLDKLGVRYSVSDDKEHYVIKGGERYAAFEEEVPGDFSAASSLAVAAAIVSSEGVTFTNLDFTDAQGDRVLFEWLEKVGVKVTGSNEQGAGDKSQAPNSKLQTISKLKIPDAKQMSEVRCQKSAVALQGKTFDLNATPDLLPALAVFGTQAKGETRLVNVAQARIKETDRISVMAEELKKMNADVEELADGLIIRNSRLRGATVSSHNDHRVAMALAVAALVAEGETVIAGAEAVEKTYPRFWEDLASLRGTPTLRRGTEAIHG